MKFTRLVTLLAILTPAGSHAAEALTYDELVQQSLQQRNAGDFAAAESSLRQAENLAAETNEVSYLLGLVLAFQERFDEAMDVIDEGLLRYPQDIQLTLAKARVYTYQNQFVEAGELTDDVLSAAPENIEALNLRANLYRYQQRFSAARQTYSEVLSLDEDNLESMIGLYDTEVGAGNLEIADSWLSRAEARFPDHIDVANRRDRASPTSRRHSITSGAAMSSFDTAFLNRWYDRFLEYRYENESGTQFFVRGDHAHRFDQHDSMFEIGGLFRLPRRGYLEVAASRTNNNDFFPENRLRISGGINLFAASENIGATSLGFTVMHSEYVTGEVSGLNLNLTHYLLNANAWLSPGIGIIEDERGDRTVNWQMGGHWQFSGRTRLGYTYINSPETENAFTTDARTHHVYANYQLTDSLTVRLDLSRHDRENSYTRDNVSLSFNLRY